MKKFSKILIATLAAILLVGALALAVFANGNEIDGKFVVAGVGYETWEEAFAASQSVHTIYLNEDVTLASGIKLSGENVKVRVNLNGHKLGTADGSKLFAVSQKATLVITGSGTIDNLGTVLVSGSESAVVTVEGTGKGIVINNNATSGDVNTFRFESYSTLNVFGKIVVNTNGVTSNRAIFNVSDGSKKTVNLNINDADILYATPSVTGAPMGKVIVSQFSNVNVKNSRLEGVYSYIIYSSTTGSVSLAGYITDTDPSTAVSYGWDPGKIETAKSLLSIDITENYTVKNSVIASTRATNYTGNSYTMYFAGATKADFTNCEIYGQYRAISGRQANNSWDAANISNKSTDASQLTFVDCHVRACEGGTIPYLFCYGPNVRFLGGSISGVSTLANCQPHYLEFDNGQWVGVYVDNVLGLSGLKGYDQAITGAWQNTAVWNPDSIVTGLLPSPVTIVVGGKTTTFTTGYISDKALYEAYFPSVEPEEPSAPDTPTVPDKPTDPDEPVVPLGPAWDFVVNSADGSNITATGEYKKVNGVVSSGSYPFSSTGGDGANKGTSTSVLGTNKKGETNGYVKFYFASDVSGGNSSSSYYVYIQTPTGAAGNILTNDAIIIEFDLSTDDAAYPNVNFTFQGRERMPRYDASGKNLGYSNTALQINAMDYTPAVSMGVGTDGRIGFAGKYANLSTGAGEWSRVTFVVDFDDTGVLEEIDVPVYAKNGNKNSSGKEVFDLVPDQYVKVKATKLTAYKIHMYVNGEYVSTNAFDVSTIGYDGYIPEGTEGNFYIDGLRIAHTATANREESWCLDNVRVSKYGDTSGVDLGYLDGDGNPKASLEGLEHFLIMPDNMALPTDPVIVDGNEYFLDGEIAAAINDGSVIELKRNMTSAINIDEILARLGLEKMSLTVITNGFNLPELTSPNYRFVENADAAGEYTLIPVGVVVDGVQYKNDADAIAAIKNGSVIVLERKMETTIDVDAILAKFGLETMSFTIIPNEFGLPTVVSLHHALAKSADADGEYVLVPVGIIVDGVRYMDDTKAIAAIKNGSVVELERNMQIGISVDAILENLGLEAIRFEIILGKFSVPAVTTSNHKIIESSGKYTITPIGINVDGFEYGTDEEAIAAIRDGSVVELNRDMKTPINVDEIIANLGIEAISFRILPGEFNFPGVISGTHKLVDYTGTFGGYLVTPLTFGEVYNVSYSDEVFGYSGTVYNVAEGTLYPVGFITAAGEEAAYDGKLWSIIGWKDVTGGFFANGFYSNNELTIIVTPEYKSETYYYEITVNEESKYVTNAALVGIEEALAKGDVKIVIWQNVIADSAVSVKGNLEIDLNGKTITVKNAFNVLPGTELSIYSSLDGAKIEASAADMLFNVEYDRRRAGDVEISVSDVEINAQGFVNYYDTYVHDPAAGNDSYVYSKILTLNAANVELNSAASSAAITTGLPIVVNAEGFDYEGLTTLLEVLPSERATLSASFKASSFKTSEPLLNVPGKNRNVSFEGCSIVAPLGVSYEIIEENKVYGEEVITIGKDCSFASDVETVLDSGFVFEAGLIVVPANAGEIKSYVNVPEAMAVVSWIGANGAPIAEPNYNAPFGKPVEQFTWEESNEKVGRLESNAWYFVAFDSWALEEIAAGGAVNVYPNWKSPEASIQCLKMDLVAYTYFKLNLYLPEDTPDGVELYGIYRECTDGLEHKRDPRYKLIDGKWYELLETGAAEIGGKNYSSYSVYPGAADASEPEYKVVFDLNGVLLVDTINCGVPTYAETAMKGIMKEDVIFNDLPDSDKILAKLVMNMVRYANESYKLANASATGAEKYEALLETYAFLLTELDSISFTEEELAVNASGLSTYMEGASFIFGAYQPRFEFKYKSEALNSLVKPETTDGRIYNWPEGNLGVFAVIYHENYDGTKSLSYIAPHIAYNGNEYVAPDIVTGAWGPITDAYATTVDMNVYNATGIINVELYTPEGVVRGSYSLAAYIDYLTRTISASQVIAAEARALAYEAAINAELALQAAAKPENAPLKEQYEALAAENEAIRIENEAIAVENEAIVNEYSSFLEASLSLYAFSLASQEYDRFVVGK